MKGFAKRTIGSFMDELNARLYRALYRIRRVEEEVARVYPTDKIKSPVHLSIGQESVAVGVCDPMRPDDVLFGTYRSHAFYLAKGGDLRAMIAELYGKVTGCAKGKGGSMHLIDAAHGVMGSSAIVATTISHACGYAYAMRCQKRDPADAWGAIVSVRKGTWTALAVTGKQFNAGPAGGKEPQAGAGIVELGFSIDRALVGGKDAPVLEIDDVSLIEPDNQGERK